MKLNWDSQIKLQHKDGSIFFQLTLKQLVVTKFIEDRIMPQKFIESYDDFDECFNQLMKINPDWELTLD